MRNKDYKKPKQRGKRQTVSQKDQTETQRIKSYDYQAWDKFNVVRQLSFIEQSHIISVTRINMSDDELQEKVLESMDTEESPVQSHDSDSEGIHVDRDLALTEKDKVGLLQQPYR